MKTVVSALALILAVLPGAPAQAAGTCVPAQLASSSYPVLLVKTRINGQGPFTFFVDTGATVTIVSTSLARRLHLQPLPVAVQGIGAGGSFSTRASMATIALGDVQERVLVATFDLTQINSAVGPTDGGLGYNFLKAYRVTIDYPGRRLCLESP